MEIEILEQNKKDGKLKFVLSKTTPAYANTLRRMMIAEVPVMAIEDIEFRANNSVLYDEMIALRLGLVPLSTDLKAYNLPSKCSCKGAGCARCQLKMTLKVEGPKTVYAGDIKSKDPKVKPIQDKMPIVKLLEGQSLEFEATSILGQGKEHAKWTPGLVYYQSVPEITIKKPQDVEKIAKVCPKNVFEVKSGKLSVKQQNACDLCEACVEASGKEVEVKGNESDFIFTIESWGQLTPKEMLEQALELFDEKAEEFKQLLKE